jgi:hypothetical protein
MPEDTSQEEPVREFDDVFHHVHSFGRCQKVLFICMNLLVFPVTSQFVALVFAFGAPGFHCVTTNVTCPPKKCCDECTSYVFDGPFNSTVTEVSVLC